MRIHREADALVEDAEPHVPHVDYRFLTLYQQTTQEKLDAILMEAKHTNGRLRDLERWRWFVSGGFAIIVFLVAGFGVYTLESGPTEPIVVDYDCSQFRSIEEAQRWLLPGDPHNIDSDNDGIPCEGDF